MLSRLALALLAVTGFVAPLAEREVDQQGQTAGRLEQVDQVEFIEDSEPRQRARSISKIFVAPLAQTSRRYLLHHAWLI